MLITAIVPARSKSRRLPFKNFMELNGVRLLDRAVSFALSLSFVDRVIVIADDGMPPDIAKVILALGRVNIVSRAINDNMHSDTIADLLLQFEQEKWFMKSDAFLILNCNIPFRNELLFENYFCRFVEAQADGLFTVSKTNDTSLVGFQLNEDGSIPKEESATALFKNVTKSEDQRLVYSPNGFFHLIKRSSLVKLRCLHGIGMLCETLPRQLVVDIDTQFDYLFAQSVENAVFNLLQLETRKRYQ